MLALGVLADNREVHVVFAQPVEAIARHHPADSSVGLAVPIEMREFEAHAEQPADGFEAPNGSNYDLLADAPGITAMRWARLMRRLGLQGLA